MSFPTLTDKRILLGSTSPRRHELLKLIVPDFLYVSPKKVEETYPSDMKAEKVPEYLSRIKAEAYKENLEKDDVLITADTIVIIDGEILGKPIDEEDAVRMIKKLAGRTHNVVTGVTLTSKNKTDSFSELTEVSFGELDENDIRNYVKKFQPLDKAGAYGIQEWIGCIGIKSIKGCFYNVMGLPLHTLATHLRFF